jgi:2-isopropylmalate synthase
VRLTPVCRRQSTLRGQGSGPVDAFVAALQAAFDAEVQVLDYHEHAIGSGAKARAACYIELRVGARRLHGVGIDADIVAASFKALLCGIAALKVACSPLRDQRRQTHHFTASNRPAHR